MSLVSRAIVQPLGAIHIVCGLLATSVCFAGAGSWLPVAPKSVSLVPVSGGVEINGARLEAAVAETAEALDAVERWITRNWAANGVPIERKATTGSVLITRRGARWNDVAWAQQQADGTTRVTFSRLDLRQSLSPRACRIDWPATVRVVSASREAGATGALEVCILEMSGTPAAAIASLARIWTPRGWARLDRRALHGIGDAVTAVWEQSGAQRRVTAIAHEGRTRVIVIRVGDNR